MGIAAAGSDVMKQQRKVMANGILALAKRLTGYPPNSCREEGAVPGTVSDQRTAFPEMTGPALRHAKTILTLRICLISMTWGRDHSARRAKL